jgi:isoleucyl-tRNA synthetase
MSFKKVDSKQNLPKMEEEILSFWKKEKIFEKSIDRQAPKGDYVFYDGPPFATGTPHYGHIVGSVMKDVVPRYWTMKGFRVERKWGWDCHGLPIENIAEKELGIKRKTEIEKIGVKKFNDFCRSKVLEYVAEWKKVIIRLGRWADMENAYSTMDLSYMESVWWVFKELWDEGLIYEGYRSMHICTRCETTLSQQEVSEGYKDIKDLSCISKFELIDEPGTFVLAWTTTPWTLVGNVALAVGKDIVYIKIKSENEILILAKNRTDEILKDKKIEILEEIKGKDLVGKRYKSLFDYYIGKGLQNEERGWQIYAADFVTIQEGTGVVHIAPAFGEDDLNLSYEYKLPFIQHAGMDGLIRKEATDFAGMNVKPAENHQATDIEIVKYLAKNNLLFAKEKYEHSYPHCWRCDTPLINYATSSWFVNVVKIKDKALKSAKDINWSPAHIKEGRFGNWLEGAHDWSISRQRYWASVMPIWKCECGEIKIFGSVKELEDLSGEKITDLHKHVMDEVVFKCEKCGKKMKRIPDVLDTWFDSGSMPYAQTHYPFENREKFEKNFPAEFIAEGVDQTRAWFYYLHLIATAIKNSRAYNNVIVNGIVVGEDGKKLAKRLKNYPDPMAMFNKYGADALRFYLASSPAMAAENLCFRESDVADLMRGPFRMLWNSYSFFALYANIDKFAAGSQQFTDKNNLLDKWIISELNVLIGKINEAMEKYELNRACRLFPKFIDNLSNWYIRRSRKRFWKSENDTDKNEAYQTLHYVLIELSKLMAPFTPFISEEIYKNLTDEESVHLAEFSKADEKLIDEKLNEEMEKTRSIITEALQLRAKAGIKVRQPLGELRVASCELGKEFADIIKEEVNVKKVVFEKGAEKNINLNTEITKDLKLEGQAREIIRFIQEMRKEAGYEVDNRIKVFYTGASEVFGKKELYAIIKAETLADELAEGYEENSNLEKELIVEGNKLKIQIKKVLYKKGEE